MLKTYKGCLPTLPSPTMSFQSPELVEAQATLKMLVLDSPDELKVLKKELESYFPESLKVRWPLPSVS